MWIKRHRWHMLALVASVSIVLASAGAWRLAFTPSLAAIQVGGLRGRYYPSLGNPGYRTSHDTIALIVDIEHDTGTTIIIATATSALGRFADLLPFFQSWLYAPAAPPMPPLLATQQWATG